MASKSNSPDNRPDTEVKIPPFLKKDVEIKFDTNILEEAQRIIYGDREKTYGHPGKNLQLIANLWTNYMRGIGNTSIQPMAINDVCIMMVLLKVARLAHDPTHHDSLVDLAGYAALMERVQNHVKNSNPLTD